MCSDSGTGNFTDIPANIETLGAACLSQDGLTTYNQTVNFQNFGVCQVCRVRYVPVGRDHQVTI